MNLSSQTFMHSCRLIFACTLLCGLAVISGCGSEGPVKITGQVTYDGQPLEMGLISFEDVEGKLPTAEGAIAAGKYEVLEVPRGNKKVKITGQRQTGSRPAYENDPNSPMIPITESIIPAKYNDKSTLTYDVTAAGTKDFELAK